MVTWLATARKERAMNRRTRIISLAAALTAVVGIGAGGGAAAYALLSPEGTTVVRQVTVTGAEPAASTNGLSVGDIYRRAAKGVVEITVAKASPSPFGGSQTQQAQGSGWVYDEQGHIVTNDHVVDGAASVSVKLWNGKT